MKRNLLNCFILIVVLPNTGYADNIKTKLENNSIVINALKTDNSLRLVLSPKGDSKIPLAPGISIESVENNKIDWIPSLPYRFSKVEGYMESPVEIMINFNGAFESATTLRITYAFCPSSDVCEFENIDLNIQP
jgi:hypothetical protein